MSRKQDALLTLIVQGEQPSWQKATNLAGAQELVNAFNTSNRRNQAVANRGRRKKT
jgi:D-Tyr-tRNAtyr deacylase